MNKTITLPKLNDEMTGAKVLKWVKKIGDKVSPEDILLEIEVNNDIQKLKAEESGTLMEIFVNNEEIISIDNPIGTIKLEQEVFVPINENCETSEKNQHKSHPHTTTLDNSGAKLKSSDLQELFGIKDLDFKGFGSVDSPVKLEKFSRNQVIKEELIKASPLARKIARENNINLAEIKGTGPDGKITEEDVKNSLSFKNTPEKNTGFSLPENNNSTITPSYIKLKINADKLIEFRKAIVEELGIFPTLNDIFINAVTQILKSHPALNIKNKEKINIGCGFIVNNKLNIQTIENCKEKSLQSITDFTKSIKENIKNNTLIQDNRDQSTFILLNAGNQEIHEFTPIMHSSEVSSLSIGSIMKVPDVKDNQISISNVCILTLAIDQNSIDYASALFFLKDLRKILENPDYIDI